MVVFCWIVILFSESLLTLSTLSDTTLLSELNFALNSSQISTFADSNFSFSYLSSDFKFSKAKVNLEP